MDLYKFLWWHGNIEMEKLSSHQMFNAGWLKELDLLLEGGKISIHRADFGKVFISCPAFKAVNKVEEYIRENPDCTAAEVQEALGLNKKQYYGLSAGLKLIKTVEGRNTLLRLDTPDTPPAEGHSDHQEPAKPSWRPSEVPQVQWDMYVEALGELKSDWKERVADHGYSLLDIERKAFVDEVDKYDLDFVMKDMGMNMKEATKFMAHLELWKLARVYQDDGIARIYEVTYGGE